MPVQTSYEIEVKTSKGLLEALEHLEVDSGVRARATIDGKKGLVFITKHSGMYSIWLRHAGSKTDHGTFADFQNLSELRTFLDPLLIRPISASLY